MNRALLSLGLIVGLSFSLVSCTKESEESSQNSLSQTEETHDYTATTEVKTAVLEEGYCANGTYDTYHESGKLCCFYKDYNRKYYISEFEGTIRIWPLGRRNGSWRSWDNYTNQITNSVVYAGMIDVGEKNAISEITEKPERYDGYRFHTTFQSFKPNHGYSVCFTTENDEDLYMRILATDYSLDENESLKTITIQYQLF